MSGEPLPLPLDEAHCTHARHTLSPSEEQWMSTELMVCLNSLHMDAANSARKGIVSIRGSGPVPFVYLYEQTTWT